MIGKIEAELKRLQDEGTIKTVQFSEWAAHIIPILKPGGSIRICGDYKTTVNQVSKLDSYLIPKVKHCLETLGGGKKFTRLDMSQAYQQLLLDEESKKYTTNNTHRGLLQNNCLSCGISSAPGIFQRNMDNLLQNIPYVTVRVNDILVSGASDEDYLKQPGRSLQHGYQAQAHDFEKTVCVHGSLSSLTGSQGQQGRHSTDAITNAPAPTNVSELKSYLGMINNYQNISAHLVKCVDSIAWVAT